MDEKKFIVRVLVTGAGGLVGNAVFRKLAHNGIEVYGLYRHGEVNKKNCIYGNLLEKTLFSTLEKYKFDHIVHCAAKIPLTGKIDDITCADENRIIDDHVISFAHRNTIRLIYFSSASVYVFSFSKLVNEYGKINCVSFYSKNKFLTEQKIKRISPKNIIMRITSPYGKNQKTNNVLLRFMQSAIDGNNIKYYGTGSRSQDFIHVDDISEAVSKSLYSDCEGVFNIASGISISMLELAHIIISLVPNTKSKVLSADIPDSQEEFRALFDISKARTELGWEPKISYNDGFSEMLDFLKQKNRIS